MSSKNSNSQNSINFHNLSSNCLNKCIQWNIKLNYKAKLQNKSTVNLNRINFRHYQTKLINTSLGINQTK